MAGEPQIHLGNYVLLLELATGGMATVYVAKQAGAAGFERLVSIKRVHRHLLKVPEFYDMFCDEARVASLIRHPNVVSVDDFVQSADELFLVQPYVESVSLSRLIEAARKAGETIPPPLVVRIIADALSGLSAAHDAVDMRGQKLSVVHRDVSPHNILVGVDGRSRIIDFGIAKAARRITTTSDGIMKGKLAYMSPEQARQQPVDARADLFALGSVLHESLTGTQLFRGEDQADVLLNVLIADIASPSTLVKDVPPELDVVVKKSLEREPENRYQTGADFLECLEKALMPAQAREVTQLIDRLCGAELEVRREAIRKSLDDPRPSEIPRLTPAPRGKNDITLTEGLGSDPRANLSKSDVTMAATQAGKGSREGGADGRSPITRTRVVALGALVAVGLVAIVSAVRFGSVDGNAGAAGAAGAGVAGGASIPAPVSASVSVPVPVPVSASASATATVPAPTTVPASASAIPSAESSATPASSSKPGRPSASTTPSTKPTTKGLKPNPFL